VLERLNLVVLGRKSLHLEHCSLLEMLQVVEQVLPFPDFDDPLAPLGLLECTRQKRFLKLAKL
jgi:hypothetical protein